MLEVKDEILNGEPLYRLVDKNNNILFDNLRIEMITPVGQEGTPLNKALFDSINADINNRLKIEDKATLTEVLTQNDNEKYTTVYNIWQYMQSFGLPSKQLSIKTGTITNKGVIPQTSGYSNYLYIVTPNTASNNFTASTSHSASDDYNGFKIYCSVEQTTRKVTAYTQSYYFTNGNIEGWTNTTSLTADYYEIAWN